MITRFKLPNQPVEGFDAESFDCFLSPRFGAKHTDHRLQLRTSLLGELQKLQLDKTYIQFKSDLVLSLNSLPYCKGIGISVSHIESLGGFVLSEKYQDIGFDLEDPKRVSQSIVARMSSAEEVKNMPTPAKLWTAKESAFKAISQKLKAEVLSEIEVCDWCEQGPDLMVFSVKFRNQKISGRGIVAPFENLNMGLFHFIS